MGRWGRTLRMAYVFFVGVVLIREFFLCILDRMLHTLFIIAVLMAAIYVFAYLYTERGTMLFRRLSALAVVLTLATMLTSAFWSLKVFHSIELFNAGIGYVCVKVFGKDAYCFSNGRESEITAGLPWDLYITNSVKDEEDFTGYFVKQYPRLHPVRREGEDAIRFHTTGSDALLAIAVKRPHHGYTVWMVAAEKEYRYKNLWGDVSYYKNPGIYPRRK